MTESRAFPSLVPLEADLPLAFPSREPSQPLNLRRILSATLVCRCIFPGQRSSKCRTSQPHQGPIRPGSQCTFPAPRQEERPFQRPEEEKLWQGSTGSRTWPPVDWHGLLSSREVPAHPVPDGTRRSREGRYGRGWVSANHRGGRRETAARSGPIRGNYSTPRRTRRQPRILSVVDVPRRSGGGTRSSRAPGPGTSDPPPSATPPICSFAGPPYGRPATETGLRAFSGISSVRLGGSLATSP